jgi:formylglycine-generating enzyme required for sulfatase activity
MISAIALGLIVLTYLIVKNWPVSPESTAPAEMVRIPAGSFMMGSNNHDNEKPPHQVYVDEFYLDKYEVTVARYQEFLAANPSQAQPGNWKEQWENLNRPVVYVSWDDAMAYCEWLSRQRGKRVRLPTEAEWEYAARGGLSGKQYPWGDEDPDGKANFGNSYASAWSAGAGQCLKNVDSFQANGYGLFNMAGNVWEWCADWYDKDYYQASPSRNPAGPTSRPSRVLRGGS